MHTWRSAALSVFLLLPLPLFAAVCHALDHQETSATGQRAVVRDDGNNLREFGGANYKQARIIGVLDQGDVVTVHRREGKWSEVTTAAGVSGWVHGACLDLLAGAALPAPREDVCPEDLPRRFAVDLDGDGRLESVSLLDRPSADGGEALLEVRDAQNRVLWKGPGTESPLLFHCRDWGIYWPSVIGDIDGDGRVELLAQEPQSDVSPSSFFLARWDGAAFRPVSQGWSLLESPSGSGRFVTMPYEYDNAPVTWIMDALALENGELRVSVYRFTDKGVSAGTAMVRFEEQGARVLRWIEPLGAP